MQHQQATSSIMTSASKVNQSKNKRSISFSSNAFMRFTIHINNYRDDEIDACFYSDDDYFQFKEDVKRTARMIEMKQTIDEIENSCRGVAESYTRDAMKRKSKSRRYARRAVMTEQLNQFLETDDGDNDSMMMTTSPQHNNNNTDNIDDKIAAAYANTTSECVVMAYIIGLSDEYIVKEQSQSQKNLLLERGNNNLSCARMQILRLTETKQIISRIHRHRRYGAA